MTPYSKLYSNLLPKFKDFNIPLMEINEIEEMLKDYLIPAITRFYVCAKDLSNRDDEIKCFNEELTDDEVEILSNYMLIEFVDSNYIRVPSILKATLSSSDFNAFSSANLLAKLLEMRNTYMEENETLLSRYAWLCNDNIKNIFKRNNK